MNRKYLNMSIILFFFSTLSVCYVNISKNILNLILICFGIIPGVFYFFDNKIKKRDFYLKNITILFFLPNFFSMITAYIYIFFKDEKYLKYFILDSIGRKINIIIYFLIFIYLNDLVSKLKEDEIKKLIRAYLLGIFLFIICIGIWQLLHVYLKIPIIKLKSRDYIHSAGHVANFIKIRVTGLANEPSYAAPYLLDALILSYYLKNKLMRYLSLFVLLATYSGGGYVNLFILILFIIFNKKIIKKEKKIKIVSIILIVTFCGILWKFDEIQKILSPILNRFSSSNNLFDIKYSIRSYMVVMPFLWILQEGILASYFGVGPGGFKYLSKIKCFYDGRPVHETSNNLFTDRVYETGYVGLFLLLFMFFLFLNRLLKKVKKGALKHKIALVLFINLIITSLYRADYFSTRFWIILILVKGLEKLK